MPRVSPAAQGPFPLCSSGALTSTVMTCPIQGGSTRKKFHAQETSQRPARSAGAIF